MIELERHIEILLLTNDCVIVPDLGGFVAHYVEARYDNQDGMFVPPLRTLGFNPQLRMNDSLLVQSYIEAYDISYPEALRRIEGEVAELRSHLETAGAYELNDIGLLTLNDEGGMEFEPCQAGILTPGLYGLTSFEMPLQAAEAKPEEQQKTQMPAEHAITIKMSWLRNTAAAAAAVVAFLMIGTPISNSEKGADVQQSAFINVSSGHHRPTALSADEPSPEAAPEPPSAAPEEAEIDLSASTTAAASAEAATGPVYCLVMASQVSERNALEFIGQLKAAGFGDARIDINRNKVRRVVYGSYASQADAASSLRQLRSESRIFNDAWVMKQERR